MSDVVQAPMIYDTAEVAMSDLDFNLSWDPNMMTQDDLPATLFVSDFPSINTRRSIQRPRTSSLSQFISRLPSLDDIQDDAGNEAEEDQAEGTTGINVEPWSITGSDYDRFCLGVQNYSESLPSGCSLPSRNTLIRYLEKYIRCAQEFLPVIHPATFSFEQKDVELLLAMAALGSLYLFEYPKYYELYFMAKAILLEKTRRESLQIADLVFGQSLSTRNKSNDLGKMQTLVLLISFSSWADKEILPDALSMGGQLAVLVRQSGISESDEMPEDVDWLSWVAVEERRRTLFAAYVLFNLHSIAFNTPPLILNHEVGICLPCYAEPWKSKNAAQWRQATRQVECHFQEGLRSLFDGTGISKDASVSSYSNYLLIHGLLQQIYIDRYGSMGSLRLDAVNHFETALRTWQSSWEATHESTLDPLSPNGPFGLTATALLRLAYIRLNNPDPGPCRVLLSRDPQYITGKRSPLNRGLRVDKAILHAAHALSIPVRQGIAFMALTKTPLWNIEHSLCSLECALLLKTWLEMISTAIKSGGTDGLQDVERKLLRTITGIIKETCLAETLDFPEDDASHFQRMAGTVVELWAQIFQGVHILEIDNVIGASLQLLSNTSPD
ncbi:MAG: hypothetical protein M1819_003442 [Sarea resinae]|nr:MAG: hypothetical protein M1819_003442 [Sarea resinae]